MGDGFLRCEYCGGTYSAEREWCPHCLAPRPEREVTETRVSDTDATVFYSDNVERVIVERGLLNTNEIRESLPSVEDVFEDMRCPWCDGVSTVRRQREPPRWIRCRKCNRVIPYPSCEHAPAGHLMFDLPKFPYEHIDFVRMDFYP